jgi:hypothetical protein
VTNASAFQQALNARKQETRVLQETVKSTLSSMHPFHLQQPFEVLSVREYKEKRSQHKMRLVGHIVDICPTSEVYKRCPVPNCSNEKLLMIPSPADTEMNIWKCSAKRCGYLISLKDGILVTKLSVSNSFTCPHQYRVNQKVVKVLLLFQITLGKTQGSTWRCENQVVITIFDEKALFVLDKKTAEEARSLLSSQSEKDDFLGQKKDVTFAFDCEFDGREDFPYEIIQISEV